MKRYASFDYDSSNEDNIKTSTTATTTAAIVNDTSNFTSNTSCNNNQSIKRMHPSSNKIGNYIIGPKLNGFNYGLLIPYLCRKNNSKDFFILKVRD